MTATRKISQDELREKVAPLVPDGIDTATRWSQGSRFRWYHPRSRTRLDRPGIPFKDNVLYAWSDDDASATKLALELLSQLGQGLLAGPGGLVNLGLAVKEVVCFLVDLKRHSVQCRGPAAD